MGSGKTSWSIQHINENRNENFLYITPFLDEVDRIINNTNRVFKQPVNRGNGKLDSINELIYAQSDIASTHELFKHLNEESRKLIKGNHYTLILDEVLNVITPYDDVAKDDMKFLQDHGCISIDDDGFVIWNEKDEYKDIAYNNIKTLALSKSLIYVNKKLLLWYYPPEIFSLFDRIYILTYLFDASIMKKYFDLYNIAYETKSIIKENNKYQLTDYFVPDTTKYIDLINIYDGKLNDNISLNYSCLSSTWFKKTNNKKCIVQLKNNLSNYFRHIQNAKSDTIMWTSFKTYKSKLKGKGYTNQFVHCNCRSTNEYCDRYNLAYCINVYPHIGVTQFFLKRHLALNPDLYALSDMIQWIWRSQIRNGEKINIYIPSERMRNLLINWLNMALEYQAKISS